METNNVSRVARSGPESDGMVEPNPSGYLAEDIRLLGIAQHMALMARTDAGKHIFESFVEQEMNRIKAQRIAEPGPIRPEG